MRRCFESISTLAVVIWKCTEGTAIIRGASKAAAAAAADAALELIFKQRLKSANVVPAVKTTLLRAPPGRGLTQYHPLSKLTGAAYPAAYPAASRCGSTAQNGEIASRRRGKTRACSATIKYTILYFAVRNSISAC